MLLLLTLILATIITAIIFATITITGVFIGFITMMMPFIIIFGVVALIIYSWLNKEKPP